MLCLGRECDPHCDLAACYGGAGQAANAHWNRMGRVEETNGRHSEHSPFFRRGVPGKASAPIRAVATSPAIGHSAAGIAERVDVVEQRGHAADNGAWSPEPEQKSLFVAPMMQQNEPEQRSPPAAKGGGRAASSPRAVRAPRNVQQEGEDEEFAPFAANGAPGVERPRAEEQPRSAVRRAGLARVAPERLVASREPEAELSQAPGGVANTPLPINNPDASARFSPVTDLIDGLSSMLAGLTARYLIDSPSFLRAPARFSVLPSPR